MSPSLDKKIAAVRSRLGMLRADVAAGHVVDAAPLTSEIQALCGAIAASPRSAGQPVLNQLLALYDEIDHLSGDMKRHSESLESKLKNLARSQTASRAYGGKSKR